MTTYTITLQPTGHTLTAPAGTPLRDLLFEQGVEFPCGGQGRCRGCKVRVVAGEAALTPEQETRLTAAEIASGWRLACRLFLHSDLTLELRQWDAAILSHEGDFTFSPRPGLGVAVDLGTTTLVAQLLDLQTSQVLAVRTALNAQARYGADVMSRIGFAIADDGQAVLTRTIRDQIGKLLRDLIFAAQVEPSRVQEAVIVGNTAMHHLFCGIDVRPLAQVPFTPLDDGLQVMDGAALGWHTTPDMTVHFLPCLGGFVGSDLLAGVLATNLDRRDALTMLVDLGTNGEIVLGNRDGLLCASTAAGPAFEGARIGMGMRAATGAISAVKNVDGQAVCHVLGNVAPAGICGSGLVDAVAVGLELGVIRPNGRLATGGDRWELAPPVAISQTDIRQLQLAKGAIAAGIRLLLDEWGAQPDDVSELVLAGAFGNYVKRISARRIGLLKFPPERVTPLGNTALLGAKLALFAGDTDEARHQAIRAMTQHRTLSDDPRFMEVYVDEMGFPRGEEAI